MYAWCLYWLWKKITKCPICRINLIKNIDNNIENVDNNIEVGEIYKRVWCSHNEQLNNFEISNFNNVRNIRTGEIIRPYFDENSCEKVMLHYEDYFDILPVSYLQYYTAYLP